MGPAAEPGPGLGLHRRELDDGVRGVLREEAAREAAARRAEGSGIETQPELGLDAPGGALPAAEITRRRLARLHSYDDEGDGDVIDAEAVPEEDESPEVEPVSGPRRNLLPDIEEINSTLRASTERERGEPGGGVPVEAPPERRRGFRVGFGVVVVLAAVLLIAYVLAPSISARVPAAAPVMHAYVASIDRGRSWLDARMQAAVKVMKARDEDGSGGSNAAGN